MQDRGNTIIGWVLFGGIVALGLSIVSGKYFSADKPHRPHEMGYVIEGVEVASDGGAAAEPSIAALMQTADAAAGEKVFAKCGACHTIAKGGANGIGPNLWGAMGKPHGHVPGFAYSDALKSVPGNWDFEGMNAWLKSPAAYASGTKMTFAGLSKPEDRANVIAYLNQNSDSPLPLPAPPAVEEAPAEDAAATEGEAPAEGDAAPAEGEAAEAPAES